MNYSLFLYTSLSVSWRSKSCPNGLRRHSLRR